LIFVDTGAFLALYFKRDQYHQEAARIWSGVEQPCVTSNLVIAETATLLGRVIGMVEAAARVADIYASPGIEVAASTRDTELSALDWMRKYADQYVSFTDCVSFALMRRHEIRTAFTFDRHFRLAGFRTIGLK